MALVTEPIALDRSLNTTEQTSRNIADVLADELSRITGRNASQVEYDNTESGLTADNVQDALDEINGKIPTVPSVDIQTAVDEFETYNGGLLSSLKVSLTPNQDLHGYDSPWVGGAGANKWDEEWRNGYYKLDTQASNYGQFVSFAGAVANKNPISVLPSTNYTMCVESGGSGSIFYYDSNQNVISHTLFYTSPFSLTTPANCAYINFNMNASPYGATYKNDIALNYPSTVTTYSPYSNICPISGHTQVDVDVSDGQTTQEQVTVNLGGTYYSGTLDVVTGVFVPDTAEKEYDGTENWVASDTGYYLNVPLSDAKASALAISNLYKYNATTWASGYFGISSGKNLWVGDTNLLPVISANNPLQVVYELANPTPIQLSPTMVKALVGENHLSAPLEGQEITESKYRELFTWDEVEAYVNAHSGGGSGMNYSTEEQVVGTWIDNKPLYAKTIVYTPSGTISSNTTIANVPNAKVMRVTEATAYNSSENRGYTLPDVRANGGTKITYDNGDVTLEIISDSWSSSWTFYVTVQYTKTTD